MKTILKSALVAACVFGVAAPAAAQAPGIDLKLNPRVGLYVPLTDLGAAESTASAILDDRSGNLAFGLGAELALAGLSVRANADYATGAEITEQGVNDSTTKTLTTLLAVSGDLILRPLPKIIFVQPYVFAGGGLRQYSFDPDNPDVSQLRDASDPTVHLGGGVDLTLGPLALNAELGDYISWYAVQEGATGEMQHDLFVSVGFVLGLL